MSDFITKWCNWAVVTDLIKRVIILFPLTTNGNAFCDQYACHESKIMQAHAVKFVLWSRSHHWEWTPLAIVNFTWLVKNIVLLYLTDGANTGHPPELGSVFPIWLISPRGRHKKPGLLWTGVALHNSPSYSRGPFGKINCPPLLLRINHHYDTQSSPLKTNWSDLKAVNWIRASARALSNMHENTPSCLLSDGRFSFVQSVWKHVQVAIMSIYVMAP